MSSNKRIYVLTHGRVGTQITLEEISKFAPRWAQQTFIVCPPEEHGKHDWPWTHQIAMDADTLGVKREKTLALGPLYQIQLDDDLRFRYRPVCYMWQDGVKGTILDDIFDWMFDTLESGYAHCGLSQRAGNNRVETDFAECTRQCDAHGFNTEVIRKEGLSYDGMLLMQDFHMTLQLIELGYPNKVAYKYSCGQQKTNAPGGCSRYRTYELMEFYAQRLKDLHPEFVTLTKKSRVTWGMQEFTDVKIQWKKALGSKRRVRSESLHSS